MRNLLFFPRWVIIHMIKLYQATLSPDHGPLKHLYPYGYCRHEPTCSQYAIEVLEKHGTIIGSVKTIWRLLHCTPWHKPSQQKILQVLKK